MESGLGKKVLLFSGGMDSVVAWRYLGEPFCVHVTGHSRYSGAELDSACDFFYRNSVQYASVDMTWLQRFEEPDATIPLRNAHFAMIGAHYGDKVYIPCQLGEQSIPDRSPAFFAEMTVVLTQLTGRTIVVSPVFPHMTKQDMLHWYLKKGFSLEDIHKAYSCFSDTGERCGSCAACFRTAIALDYCHVLPDNYFERDIWKWEGIQEYITKLQDGKYEPHRTRQTLNVLRKRGLVS